MPPTSKEDLAQLKRMTFRLELLEGAPLVCLEGLALVRLRAIRAPAELLDDLDACGGLSVRALARFADLERDPVLVEPRWLAAAQRDLKVLEQSPAARRQISESRRAFRRVPAPDAPWLADRQRRIDALCALLHRPSAPAPAAARALVEAPRGPEAAGHLARWRARSVAWGRLQRDRARRRVEQLAAMAAGRAAPRSDLPKEVAEAFLDRLARRGTSRGPGRALPARGGGARVRAGPAALRSRTRRSRRTIGCRTRCRHGSRTRSGQPAKSCSRACRPRGDPSTWRGWTGRWPSWR